MEWQEGDIDIPGIRIHYYRRGNGRPLVLAHGMSDNGKCWSRLGQRLEDRFDIIAYDARYHGLSGSPDIEGVSMGDELIQVVEALELDRPALIGHSMGARTVAEAASTRPELFRCAVLEDPPWRDAVPDAPAGAAPAFPDLKSLTTEGIIALGKRQSPSWHEDEFAAWAESKQQFHVPADWLSRRPPSLDSWREGAAAIGVPTLLVTGDSVERRAIVSAEVAAEVCRINGKIETVRLAGAGHNIRREAFEPYVEAVSAFLARH